MFSDGLATYHFHRGEILEQKERNECPICYKLKSSLLQTQIQFVTNSNPVCYKLKSSLLQTQIKVRPFVSGFRTLWAEIIGCDGAKELFRGHGGNRLESHLQSSPAVGVTVIEAEVNPRGDIGPPRQHSLS